ncbi:MAG: hypothetical protein Q9160_001020 [Pyrenula sp. 1 TL-2023]
MSQNARGIKKTRSGCVTCKRRKVKCDESQPTCRRCINSGQHCEGYDIWHLVHPRRCSLATAKIQTNLTEPILVPFHATDAEWQAHTYYIKVASIHIGWEIDHPFWHTIVPQIAESETCVRYAIIALGSFSKHTSTRRPAIEANCICEHCLSGLKYYNKAITSLNKHLQGDKSQQLVLLVCILFTCIELIQGRQINVISLIRHGYSVLESFYDAPRIEKDIYSSLTGGLTEIFERMRLLSNVFGHPIDGGIVQTKKAPSNCKGYLLKAREVLYTILNDGHALIRQSKEGYAFVRQSEPNTGMGSVAKSDTERLHADQTNLGKRLDQWHREFFNPGHSDPNDYTLSGEQEAILMFLKTYYFLARIWVATAFTFEHAFTDYIEQFRCIVDHASLAIRQQADFMFDNGLIGPLYFTAVKCRDPKVRRKALALLSKVSRREGLWDRDVTYAVAKRAMDLEESSGVRWLFSDLYIGPQRLVNGAVEVSVQFCWHSDHQTDGSASMSESIVIASEAK